MNAYVCPTCAHLLGIGREVKTRHKHASAFGERRDRCDLCGRFATEREMSTMALVYWGGYCTDAA